MVNDNLGSLAYERKGDGICVAYYNTPKNLHALTPNQQHETFLVLEYARRDPACKVLIWTATGQRAFSSGAAFGVTQVDLDPEVAAAYLDGKVLTADTKQDATLIEDEDDQWSYFEPTLQPTLEAAGSPTRITLELPEPLMTSVSTINVIATPSSPFSQLPRSPPSSPSEGGTSDAGNVDSPGVSDEGQCEPPRGSQRRHLESSATALQPHPPRMSKAPPSNVQLQDNRRVGPAIKTPTALLVCVDSIAGGEPERFSRPFAGRRARLRRQRRAHRVRAALAKAAAPVFDAETEQGDSVGEGDSVVGGRGYTEYARLFASLGYVVRWRSLV